jgi:hypothetical protein
MIGYELLQNTRSRVDTEASTRHNLVDLKTEESRSLKSRCPCTIIICDRIQNDHLINTRFQSL